MPCTRLISLLLLVVLGIASGCCTERTITVATDAVFPPFHYVDEDGNLAGHDVELAREVLARAGYRAVKIVQADSYAALYTGLEAGDYDVIAATTGITPERQAKYGFSTPYFETLLAVIVRDQPGEPRSPSDLAGRAIAASRGTTSARAAHQVPGAIVLEMSRAAESLAALRSGEADGMIVDEFEAVPWAAEAPDLVVLPEAIAIESYGLVTRLDDDALRARLNAALEAMRTDGTLDALRTRFDLGRPIDWPVGPPASGR